MSDWIKIHRSILESYSFANPVSFKIWAWMLLKANYKTSFAPLKIGKGTISVKIERGQFIFGRNKAEKELNIDGSTIYRTLQKFEELKQIKIEASSQYSIITICNYDFYQSKQDQDEQPTNNLRTGNEQPTNSTRTTDEHIKEELESKEKIFNNKPIASDFNGLPDINRGMVYQLVKITKNITLSDTDIDDLWEVFKIQNLKGKKPYTDADAVYSHFVNWAKDKKFEAKKLTPKTDKNSFV